MIYSNAIHFCFLLSLDLTSSHFEASRKKKGQRVLTADLFASPPRSFVLPPYAEKLARDFIAAPSPILHDRTRHDFGHGPLGVLRFLDYQADQTDSI